MNPIRVFFETKLAAFAAAQTVPLAVAYEGVPFTKPQSAAYLECYLISSAVINPTVDGTRTRSVGVFQVNIVTPDGLGSKQGEELALGIIALYPLLPKGAVSVEQTPHAERAQLNLDGHRVLPVLVKYRYEATI